MLKILLFNKDFTPGDASDSDFGAAYNGEPFVFTAQISTEEDVKAVDFLNGRKENPINIYDFDFGFLDVTNKRGMYFVTIEPEYKKINFYKLSSNNLKFIKENLSVEIHLKISEFLKSNDEAFLLGPLIHLGGLKTTCPISRTQLLKYEADELVDDLVEYFLACGDDWLYAVHNMTTYYKWSPLGVSLESVEQLIGHFVIDLDSAIWMPLENIAQSVQEATQVYDWLDNEEAED